MTLAYYAGALITGTNANRTGGTWTNLPAGWRFLATDTLDTYYWNGTTWTLMSSASGEANTASNVGTGQGVWKAKTGVDLSFRSLTATSSKIALANNTNDVGIDVTEANLALANISGILAIGKGGTGQTTATAAFDALSAMTTLGDTQYGGTAGTRTRLAGNITTTKKFLRQTGDATNSAVPAWDTMVDADLPTTLAGHTLTTATLTTPIINGIKGGDVAITNSDSPYTALATTRIIRADATSGAITINLPTAVGIAGFEYHIFRTDIILSTNIITIDANSTETIDSNLTYLLFPAEWIKIESDGANWQVIGRPTPSLQGYYYRKGATANRTVIAGLGTSQGANVNSTTSPTANILYAYPLFVNKTTKFDQIHFSCSTGGSGNARVGIYRDDGNMYPGVLIFDTGSISTTAPGQKVTAITAGLQVFQPGLYWLVWETDSATGQYKTLSGFATVNPVFGFVVNWDLSAPPWHYNVAHTFGALPDPYTAAATLDATAPTVSAPRPAVGLRPI